MVTETACFEADTGRQRGQPCEVKPHADGQLAPRSFFRASGCSHHTRLSEEHTVSTLEYLAQERWPEQRFRQMGLKFTTGQLLVRCAPD